MPKQTHKLSDADAKELRELRANIPGITFSYLAELFEISTAGAHRIVTGGIHKNAGGPIEAPHTLTDEQVIEIRKMRANGMSYAQISERTGKKMSALRSICSGHSFPKVGGPLTPARSYRRS